MKRLAFALLAGLAAGPATANPLGSALEAGNGILCFSRSYDRAWLKAHPGQTVRGVTLAISDDPASDYPVMRLAVLTPRGPLFGFGQCWWETNINRGVQNDILDPTFKPTIGVYCHMVTDITGGSAEEGAEFSVDWRDGRTIQAHLPEGLAMWASYDISGTASWYDVKRADRIVRLNRAPASACAALVTNFAPKGLDS